MSQAIRSARQDTDGFKTYLLAAYYLLSGDFLLISIVAGIVFFALGAAVITPSSTIFGAMFGVWGVSLVVFGLLSYVVLWANARLR